jgi:hypothetical protein
LEELATATDGEGLLVKVRFVKNQAAPPVRYAADESVPAAAIREVDLQAKYHRSAAELAEALDLTQPKCLALRRHLGIDADPACSHEFVFSSQRLKRFSDNAFTRMRTARDTLDLEAVWRAHNPSARQLESCKVPGCRAG